MGPRPIVRLERKKDYIAAKPLLRNDKEWTTESDSSEEAVIYSISEKPSSNVGLKAEMGLLNGCTVIIGSIIGSGIFVSPTGVIQSTGSVNLALVVWVLAGIFSMIGSYCYAELGCMIRKSGADYAYIHFSYGPFIAFIRLWIECIILRPCIGAIQALTFALYVLKPFFPECDPPDESVRILAAVCLCLLCFINCVSVRLTSMVQDYFTYAKLLALLLICLAGVVKLAYGKTEYFTWENSETNPTIVALSFYSGLYSYTGWNYLNFLVEEMKDPVKDLPRAIAISCSTVLVVYVLTIVSFHTTLSVTELLGSDTVAITFTNRIFSQLAWVMSIFVACSTFGGVNGTLLTASRMYLAGAREGHMPVLLTMIQVDKATPVPSIIALTLMCLMYLTSSDIIQLMNYVGFSTWLSIGVTVSCLPYLRWKYPDMDRPIKVSLIFPAIYLLMTLVITVLPMVAKPFETGIGLLMILTSVPVYFFFIHWKNKPVCVMKLTSMTTSWLQRVLMVLPEEKSL